MSLRAIKTYLQQHQRASLTQLAYHLHTSPELVEDMLQHWQRKGKVQRLNANCSTGGCSTNCGSGSNSSMDIYEWTENTPPPAIAIMQFHPRKKS